jgi:hypothetical protein
MLDANAMYDVVCIALTVGGTRDSRTNARRLRKVRGTRNLRNPVFASKLVNIFTRALRPPFIGRRRDFYIPRSPSNLENIHSVNMYMNVFFCIS